MPDGTRLAARIWLPEDAHPVPAILDFLPYRQGDLMAARDAAIYPYLAARGYACARVDLRGTGNSEGIIGDEYTPQELQDGCDVIAWLAAQPWCDGNVGMTGISWGGFNSLQVAALRPAALRAVLTLCASDDRYADDVHYRGGCVLAVDMLQWAVSMLVWNALPPDPAVAGAAWRGQWLDRLTRTPAFLEPFHEPGAGIHLRPHPAITRHARPPGRAAGHMAPARQGPHRAGEHDHEAGHPDEGQLGNHAGQQEAHAEQKADRRLNYPALVMHPRILRAHRLRELWILGIERTLDLIELTLFVLRQRHGASHETSRAGTGAMSSSHGPGFFFQNTSPAALVGRVVGG